MSSFSKNQIWSSLATPGTFLESDIGLVARFRGSLESG